MISKFISIIFLKDVPCGESVNDLIKVGELTPYEINVWKFPNILKCPIKSCRTEFETRDLAIKHYTEVHAKFSALCKVCEYPLYLLQGVHHFTSHFTRKHPNVQPPKAVKILQVQDSLIH